MLNIENLKTVMKTTIEAEAAKPEYKRDEALDALAAALTSYIQTNTDLNFSWTGYSGDSSQSDELTANFTNLNIQFTETKNSINSDGANAMSKMSADLKTSISAADYEVAGCTGAGNLTSLTDLSLTQSGESGANTQDKSFENLASQIITWLQSNMPVAFELTRSGYTGMTVPVAIL